MMKTVWMHCSDDVHPVTTRLTGSIVLPPPLVVLVNVMVSEYVLGARPLALPLSEAVTVVLAPAASEPLVAESVSQLAVLAALQFTDPEPILFRVYVLLDGLNGPPCAPALDKPLAAGVT